MYSFTTPIIACVKRLGMRIVCSLAFVGLILFVPQVSCSQEAWRIPLDLAGNPPLGNPATDGARIFVTVASEVRAYSLADGDLLWRAPLHQFVPWNLVVASGRVFVTEASVAALDAVTGRRLWEFPVDADSSLGRAVAGEEALFVGTSSGEVYALRISDGHELWAKRPLQESKYSAVIRGLAIAGKEIYVAAEQWRDKTGAASSGWLFALDLTNGNTLWSLRRGSGRDRHGFSSAPVVLGGLILLPDYPANAVVAVDLRTHKEAWHFNGDPQFGGPPSSVIVSTSAIYFGSGDTNMYALDPKTGGLMWKTKLPGSVVGYGLCGSTVLANFMGIAMLDARTGSITESIFRNGNDFATTGFVTVGDRFIVLGPKAIYSFRCNAVARRATVNGYF